MALKRLFDFILSLVTLIALWPMLAVIAVAIAVDSPGGVLFGQERVGKGGNNFRILKFRSMVTNAENLGSYQTAEGDSRITRVGRFLRRTSLDELPQLINVLKGDMSLVGPRPDVPAQRTLYTNEEWALRTSVRPGITGLAQATLRSAATEAQRKALDMEYVQKASVWFDLKIVLLTVRQVLGKGSF
jgi:lipopolysaccharide/colanic/teichoic acid biosynthesis glycosyltransferase